MAIDDSSVKGRGAQADLHNRFNRNRYVAEHPEGIDIPAELEARTKIREVFPKSIVNPVPSKDLYFNWSMNPYQGCEHGCSYCYARPTHEYWGYNAGLDFEQVIMVKRNAPDLLRKFLSRRHWKPEMIALSGATDPYQPIERTERISRHLLEVMLQHRAPVGIITKNNLIVRDIDLLREMASMDLVHVSLSITTLNEELRRKLEPRTSTGIKRLQALEELSAAGVPVNVMLAPVIPALNSSEIPEIVKSSADAGARSINYVLLRLNGSVADVFSSWVHQYYPDRAEKILNQVSATHGGQVTDHRPGIRMRGEGSFAEATHELFRIHRDKYFKDRSMPSFDLSRFRSLKNGQLPMF
jgi:DNA repair photolyase